MTTSTASPATWTIAWRKPTASTFHRATNFAGTWQQASELNRAYAERYPDLEVWHVTTREWDLANPDHEDAGNILVASGRRVRLVDNGLVDEDLLPEPPAPAKVQRLLDVATGFDGLVVEENEASGRVRSWTIRLADDELGRIRGQIWIYWVPAANGGSVSVRQWPGHGDSYEISQTLARRVCIPMLVGR